MSRSTRLTRSKCTPPVMDTRKSSSDLTAATDQTKHMLDHGHCIHHIQLSQQRRRHIHGQKADNAILACCTQAPDPKCHDCVHLHA